VFLNLYLVLDLFSRFPVAWMVAAHENSSLAKQLIAQAFSRQGLAPGAVTVHNDRGAPMTAIGFVDLLAELGVKRSLSRPRVSNDNPFSESCFKTIKYQPDFPGRFRDIAHARRWCADFFDWYANRHRHSELALFTPADVFHGRVPRWLPSANRLSMLLSPRIPSASSEAVPNCPSLQPSSPSIPLRPKTRPRLPRRLLHEFPRPPGHFH